MRWIAAILLIGHGLIHLMGFSKAFGYADLPMLTQPISREMGIMWLAAALLVMTSAVVLLASPRHFFIVGAIGLTVSQVVILSAWTDAKAGTIPNLVLLIFLIYLRFVEGR